MEHLVTRGLVLWRSGERLLGPIDLSLQAGMRVALTGRSGSGTSRLLHTLALLLPPDEGTVTPAPGVTVALARQDVRAAAADTVRTYALKGLSRLRQLEAELRRAELKLDSEAALQRYGDLATAFEQAGGYTAEAGLRELLAAFGLGPERHDQPVASLSGGERRRLELARTLAARPDVLLLDSPEAGLDAELRDQLAARLAAWSGSLVFSSHDRHFINRVATHTAELKDGAFHLRRGGFPLRRTLRRPAAAGGSRRELLGTEGITVPLGNGSLVRSGDLRVHTGDRIVLVGENGSGKSTLLDFIATDLHYGQGDSGLSWAERTSLTYIDQQHSGLDPAVSALENLTRRMSRERARQLLGFVHLPSERWDEAASLLTRAERARAGLALLLADESELLLLDEAEAGLDLPATLLLENAVLERPGAVIMVTHDRQLADNVASRVWSLSQGELQDWRGGMDGFRAGRLRREEQLAPAPRATGAQPEPTGPDIEGLEDSLRAIDERLDERQWLPERHVQRLTRQRQELMAELMEAYDSQFPEPAPRFRVREGGIVFEADLAESGSDLQFTPVGGAKPELRVQAGIAHLRLEVPADRCLLPRVRRAMLNAAVRLAFYALSVRVVQYFDRNAPGGLLLEPAGSGWFALSRPRFEQLEGWSAPVRTRSQRRRRTTRFPES